ncbi:MAG TPA: hypothetical protein VNO86_11085, partial [Candidatus Binatia bacterium]|nr:hypothetical protein [Candidatus Binatia bacterium]
MWSEAGDLPLARLWSYFASYLYLPRLRDRSVLAGAVEDAVRGRLWEQEGVAYAAAKDADGRYRGLVGGRPVQVVIDAASLIVRPEVAAPLLAEAARAAGAGGVAAAGAAGGAVGTEGSVAMAGERGIAETMAPLEGAAGGPSLRPSAPLRFRGSVSLDAGRPIPDFSRIAQEVISHLTGDPNVRVELRLEIDAEHRGSGFEGDVVRTVRENARTLRFDHVEFEEE